MPIASSNVHRRALDHHRGHGGRQAGTQGGRRNAAGRRYGGHGRHGLLGIQLRSRRRQSSSQRLAAGGRWIRSYGGLRLPKKPKDSAIPGVAIKRFCPRFCSRVAICVYPGSRSRTLVDPATECLPGQYALIWILEMDRRSAGGFPRTSRT